MQGRDDKLNQKEHKRSMTLEFDFGQAAKARNRHEFRDE